MPDLPISSAASLSASTIADADLIPVYDASAAAGSKGSKILWSEAKAALGVGLSVKAYGATGDARKVTDAVLDGTTTVTSATASFTSADVGKVIWGVETSSGTARLAVTTVASVTNSTTIVVTDASSGSYTGISLVLGTDDTAAIQAAVAAAKANDPTSTVVVPAGGYIFNELLFDGNEASVASGLKVLGAGSSNTIFYLAPDYDTASTTSNTGAFFRTSGNTRSASLQGVQVDGSSLSISATGYHVISDAGDRSSFVDVQVSNCKGFSDLGLFVGTHGTIQRCKFEGGGYVGMEFSGCGYNIFDTYSGNHAYLGVYINAVTGATNAGIAVKWFGGNIDECASGASCYITGSTDVTFIGARFYGFTSGYACDVVGSSTAKFIGCEIVGYGATGNRNGLDVASGCTVYLSCCRLDGVGTGNGLTNAGTVYDCLGNVIDSISGTAPVLFLDYDNMASSDPTVKGVVWRNAGVLTVSAG